MSESDQWQTSHWHEQPKGQAAPLCPKCGGKLRQDDRWRDAAFPGFAHPPWNAGWDGTCEQCHHRFELVLGETAEAIPALFGTERTVRVRPQNHPFHSHIDGGQVLTGVEVTVIEKQYGRPVEETTLFLGMAELKRLLEGMKQELAVCQEQFDWTCDWT